MPEVLTAVPEVLTAHEVDEDAEAVTCAIAKCADTGTIGDGKIWVSTVDSAIRVRTGERDNSAV